VLGSTARELVHRARCPVLIVRGEDAGGEESVR
jgi:nucleotide-binding universal stress UspA family protein